MMTAGFFFLLITAAAAVLALLVTGGRPTAVKLAVLVALEAVAIPFGATYGAYQADHMVYLGRQTACERNLKNLEVAVHMYATDWHDRPSRLGQLTPDYLKQLPTCPGHQLVGAYDSDSEGQDYRLGPDGPGCPTPPGPDGYFDWLRSRK